MAATAGPDTLETLRYEALEAARRERPSEVLCTVCGHAANAFLPGGVHPKRPNAKCPECGSLERHRLLWLYLANHAWGDGAAGKRDVLHVSPEPFLRDRLKGRPDVNYVSGDLFVPGSTCRLDLTDMCFWDEQFDLVLCSHVLEHIPDDGRAMREMRRVLRPTGRLVLMVPVHDQPTYEDPSITDPAGRLAHFGQEDHVRRYGPDIVDRLDAAGFDVETWPRSGAPSEATLRLVAVRRRTLFACTPRPSSAPAGR